MREGKRQIIKDDAMEDLRREISGGQEIKRGHVGGLSVGRQRCGVLGGWKKLKV